MFDTDATGGRFFIVAKNATRNAIRGGFVRQAKGASLVVSLRSEICKQRGDLLLQEILIIKKMMIREAI